MYDDSLIQSLHGILSGSNAGSTKRQFIGDLGTFILSNIPYAQVQPKDLQTGLITMDGPKAIAGKPLLVWHFGGFPYPVERAALIEYVYVRNWDGSGQTVHASILFGFQTADRDRQTLKIAPHDSLRTTRARRPTTDFVSDLRQAVTRLTKTVPSAVLSTSTAQSDLTGFVMDQLKLASGQEQFAALTSGGAIASAGNGAVVGANPGHNPGNGDHSAKPRGLVRRSGGSAADEPFDVEFDGPARDHDSHHIFPYTLETLFNDQTLFDQILWWYFAGRPMRITKAMRIPLTADSASASLFVGYSGPGSHP
jgi:hypothetical protein